MERKVLPSPAVAEELKNHFVEARLHADMGAKADEHQALQLELTRNLALPIYVILDPETRDVLGISEGLSTSGAFVEFLRNARP